MRNRYGIAGEFLARWFGAEDTFALLLRHADPSRTGQRIVRQNDILKSNYLGWLAHENAHGSNVHFSVNPLLFGAKKRTKNAIAEARALFLDLDEDGDRKMAAIRASNSVPPPSFIIRTSPGKYQILWRVGGFSIPEQEAMLKTLAATFGGDRACTDCARVLRLPGFFNRKYAPACPVTLASDGIPTVYSPEDFILEMPSLFTQRHEFLFAIEPIAPTPKLRLAGIDQKEKTLPVVHLEWFRTGLCSPDRGIRQRHFGPPA